jgi:hypothetical protein
MGTVEMGADEYIGPHALEADAFTLPELTGGTVHFSLDAGAANGGRNYIILGSYTGNAPGFPLPGGMAVLPINNDYFTFINVRSHAVHSAIYGTAVESDEISWLNPSRRGAVYSLVVAVHAIDDTGNSGQSLFSVKGLEE